MSSSMVAPVKPYTSTIPYSSTAELIPLRMRNFMPASAERPSRLNAASAATGSAVSSREMYSVMSSTDEASSIMPLTENSNSA